MNGVLKILPHFLTKPQHSLRSIFWIRSLAWNLCFYTNTWIVLLIKLQALAPVKLLTYINYITKYITSIFFKMFWYYLLAPIGNSWKLSNRERYIPIPLEQRFFFYQMYTLKNDICLILLSLKMSISISNSGFILQKTC